MRSLADLVRIDFEAAQLQVTRDRLASLRSQIDAAETRLADLAGSKATIEEELAKLGQTVEKARKKVERAREANDTTVENVMQLRYSSRQTSRALDKALKDIAGWNDEIVKSASDRHAIYRRCRLEEIDLPLDRGRLDKIPLEAVSDLRITSADRRPPSPIPIWTWRSMTTGRNDQSLPRIMVWSQTLRIWNRKISR